MKTLLTISEIAKLQNISRQTLIYYDKIGLFCPAYTDPDNGYRYYGIHQLDILDTICIMKRIGFSLEEIKSHLKNYTLEHSVTALKNQLKSIDKQIRELETIKSRVEHRCKILEQVSQQQSYDHEVRIENVQKQFLFVRKVKAPYTMKEISIATKECFVRSFKEQLPIFFQSGVIVPYDRIQQGKYIEASHVFVPIEISDEIQRMPEVMELPEGTCISTYHTGDYLSIGKAYERILDTCKDQKITLRSDSYEFAINDYLSTKDENEYITKIMFYI